jgi:hypothetical protein
MPRPLRTDIDRPDCPGHRGGRVWLDGRYADGSGAFERTRFTCVPPTGGDWKRHAIWPELPRQRPTPGLDDERAYTRLLKAALRREGGHPLLHGREHWRDRCDRREEPSSLRVLLAT